MTTTSARFQQNGYSAAYLAAQNPVPANRELMFETDTSRFKIGDGTTPWSSLHYFYGRVEAQADISAAAAAIPRYTQGSIGSDTTDWNTITASGWYSVNYANNWGSTVNAPTRLGTYGLIEVFGTGEALIQRYTTGDTPNSLAIRQRYDGGWSSWRYYGVDGKTVTNAASTITGWFHVDNFGAKGDGGTDDTAAIQLAVNSASYQYRNSGGIIQRVFFKPGFYIVSAVPMLQSNGSADGACSIHLLDGVELYGPGATVKVKNGAYGNGAFYAIVRSSYEGLSNASITGLTFDGNRSQNVSSTNAGNILLEALNEVYVKDVKSIESNGNGIMVRGNAYGSVMQNVRVENCRVNGINGIGIQCAQFYSLQILGNNVSGTSDNCIDVYGEYGNHSTTSSGGTFMISNNHCSNGGAGIFLETVVDGNCVGNVIDSCNEGFHINRINGEPHNLAVKSNSVFDCSTAVGFTGDSGGVTIQNNTFERFTVGGVVCGGAGNVGSVYILDNTMNGVNTSTPLVMIKSGTNQTSNFVHLRTMTRSKNRAYDTLNFGPATVSSSWAPAFSPGD